MQVREEDRAQMVEAMTGPRRAKAGAPVLSRDPVTAIDQIDTVAGNHR
jgi:hypothetical protein